MKNTFPILLVEDNEDDVFLYLHRHYLEARRNVSTSASLSAVTRMHFRGSTRT